MAWSLAAILSLGLTPCPAAIAQQQQPAVPDAPTPQPPPKLSGADGTAITPGKGAGDEPTGPSSSSAAPDDQAPPSSLPPSTQGKDNFQPTPPELPAPGEGLTKHPQSSTLTSTSSRFRSPSRTPRESSSPASPGAISGSLRTTPASRCACSPWTRLRSPSFLSLTRA